MEKIVASDLTIGVCHSAYQIEAEIRRRLPEVQVFQEYNTEDIGKVIGRQGRNIASLRVLLHAIGAKERKHILLEVLEDPTMSEKRTSH